VHKNISINPKNITLEEQLVSKYVILIPIRCKLLSIHDLFKVLKDIKNHYLDYF